MGQGAAMAIEDALSIATLLPLGTKAEDIPSRLAIYEKARQPRVDDVLMYTRLNGADEDDPSVQRMTGKTLPSTSHDGDVGMLTGCYSCRDG